MNTFDHLTALPLFGILLCLITYVAAAKIRQATGSVAANPFLLATVMVVIVLLVFDIPFENFDRGGQYIIFSFRR